MARRSNRQDAEVHWDGFKPQVKPQLSWDGMRDEIAEQMDEAKEVLSNFVGRIKGFGQRAR